MVDNLLAEPGAGHPPGDRGNDGVPRGELGATDDAATAGVSGFELIASILAKLIYPAALLASLSIWTLALRAPLWLDETLAYWQVSGRFWKIWSRSAMMPSSIGYLYTLWAAKSILGTSEIALKIPSTFAMLAAVYFLFRATRELFDQETAFLACIFFSLTNNVVFAATDARPYAFALLATNLATFAFARWMNGHTMRQAILFSAAAAGIVYFHYLFGAILPVFAIYYLIVRARSIKADLRQLAALLGSFTLFVLPLIYRVASLYHTKQTHVVQEMHHPVLMALNILAPAQLLIGFVVVAAIATLLRKLTLPVPESFSRFIFGPLLALVPAAVLFAVSAVTDVHLVIPRYLTVVAPGSALTWALLTRCIDSAVLRRVFCVGLVATLAFESYSSPLSRKHEINFKEAHAFINENVAGDQGRAAVLVFSAFIESNYEPLPTDLSSENALASQATYYPIHAPVVMMPMALNNEAMQIGRQAISSAAQKGQRFLAIAAPTSFESILWLANESRGTLTARQLRMFDQIVVVEFRPVAATD